MKDNLVAERYARALFLALQEEKEFPPEQAWKQLSRTVQLLVSDLEVQKVLENPFVPLQEKKAFLKKKAGGPVKDFSTLLMNFLNLVVSKKRIQLLPLILQKFEAVIDESKGAMRAYVQSASSLNEQSKLELERKLSRLFKRRVSIETSTSPELLAGIVVQAEGTVIDNSLKSQLKNMKGLLQ